MFHLMMVKNEIVNRRGQVVQPREVGYGKAEDVEGCLKARDNAEASGWDVISVIYGYEVWKVDMSGRFLEDALKQLPKIATRQIVRNQQTH